MFSGIVERMGLIRALDLSEKWGSITMETEDWDPPVKKGDSIAVQGICLTLARKEGNELGFDILRETFDRTTLGDKTVGNRLNLERSLRWGDPMGGHIVVGHVDGVGEVKRVEPVGRDWRYEFTCDPVIMDSMVFKGSVSIDGVSLTVADLSDDSFTVHIIPYTWENTTFHELKAGSKVNLEIDLLGKYVRRLIDRGKVPFEVTWETLRESGLINEATS